MDVEIIPTRLTLISYRLEKIQKEINELVEWVDEIRDALEPEDEEVTE